MGDRIHAAAMLGIAALGFVGWTLYWTTDLFVNPMDPFWNRYEDTFVLADGLMCSAYLASGLLLIRRRVLAVPMGIAAAGAMVFLLALDFLFNVQNGHYRVVTPVMALEIGIDLLCLAFGPFTIVRLWRRRLALEPMPMPMPMPVPARVGVVASRSFPILPRELEATLS
jgi:hypothetical protein